MSETPLPGAPSHGSLRSFKDWLRQISTTVLGPIARGLYAIGIRPDHITVLGLLLSVVAGALFMFGQFRYGALIAVLSGLCDMMDGQLAKVRGTASRFGAFLDSTLDRLADGAILLGLAAFYMGFRDLMFHPEGMTTESLARATGLAAGVAPGPAPVVGILALLGLLGSLLVSYTRARAEGLGLDCNVGWFERPERLVLLIVAALFGVGPVMPWALLILTILSFVTAAQRVGHVYMQTRGSGNDS